MIPHALSHAVGTRTRRVRPPRRRAWRRTGVPVQSPALTRSGRRRRRRVRACWMRKCGDRCGYSDQATETGVSWMRTYLRRAIAEYGRQAGYDPVPTTTTTTTAAAGSVAMSSAPSSSSATASAAVAEITRLTRYYHLDAGYLPPSVRSSWAPLAGDAATMAFLDSCQPQWWVQCLATVLRWFYSVTDTNAILNRGHMFVVSTAHARDLLTDVVDDGSEEGGAAGAETVDQGPPPFDSLLDVGAGDGGVTACLRPLFRRITATEVSPFMITRLRDKGYTAIQTAFLTEDVFPAAEQFDVVSIFNVLDRCDHPRDLLKGAMRLMKPDGQLLLAVVLPFSEFVEEGTKRRRVHGPLPMGGARCCDGASFEESLAALISRVLIPLGLRITRIAKVPYLCRGDLTRPYYVLADAIIVCRKGGAADTAAAANHTTTTEGGVGGAITAPSTPWDARPGASHGSGGSLSNQATTTVTVGPAIAAPTATTADPAWGKGSGCGGNGLDTARRRLIGGGGGAGWDEGAGVTTTSSVAVAVGSSAALHGGSDGGCTVSGTLPGAGGAGGGSGGAGLPTR